jgi:hypothetical protein
VVAAKGRGQGIGETGAGGGGGHPERAEVRISSAGPPPGGT